MATETEVIVRPVQAPDYINDLLAALPEIGIRLESCQVAKSGQVIPVPDSDGSYVFSVDTADDNETLDLFRQFAVDHGFEILHEEGLPPDPGDYGEFGETVAMVTRDPVGRWTFRMYDGEIVRKVRYEGITYALDENGEPLEATVDNPEAYIARHGALIIRNSLDEEKITQVITGKAY